MRELFLPIRHFAEWVNEIPSSVAIRESQFFSPYLTVSHVVVMAFVAGLVLMMDLRLLGVANMRTPFSELQRRLFPWQMFGMTLAAITGLVLAFSDPMRFYANIFFWMKMTLMVIAALNAMAFHYIAYHDVGAWDNKVPPAPAKLAGALGLALWAFVIVAGRLIPYNWFQ